MAEPLTFKFVFADESEAQGAPQAPPEAQPGAAQRANPTPQGQRQPPPQSRPAPQPNASPEQPPSRPPGSQAPGPAEADEPRRPRRTTGRQPERAPEAGEAQRVLSDLIRHLSTLPTVGGAIGTLSRIAEPLLKARDQIEALAERRRAAEAHQAAQAQGAHNPPEVEPRQRRRAGPRPAAEETEQSQPTPKPQPAPQQPQAAAQPTPATRQPEAEPEEKAAPGTVRNPTPGAAAAAMEQIISALGPLPQSQKELTAALRPLEALGYTLKELKAAVDRMRQQQARPPQPQAVPTGARPPKPGAATITTADIRGANRPPKPGAATITPADIRPGSTPSPGGAAAVTDAAAGDAAAGAGAAEAAGAGAVAAGAAGGPVGLVAGIAVVAAVGAATRAFSALTGSVEKIDRSFTELSSRLAPFNGRLAFAQAQARTQQTLLDIERAGRLGGDLAKFTDERARLSREFQRLATELEAAVLPAVNGAAELLADTVQGIRESMSAASELIGGLLSGMSLSEASTAAATNGMKKHLDAQEADRKSKEMMDIAGVFFGERGQQKGLNIGGVNYGSANDWADYIPQAAPRRVNNQRAFGGI